MDQPTDVPRFLLTADEAARALAISRHLLWTLTAAGELPCVRVGRAVRYDRADLLAWIAARKGTSTSPL